MTKNAEQPPMAVKTKAKAKGNLDKLSPGDPGYGGKSAEPFPESGVVSDKEFQHSEDHDAEELVRVFHDGKVVFSGTRAEAKAAHKSLSDFLKK